MKKVGIHEIARLAQVSIGTVDRALHGRKRISETTRRRILEIAERVGYKPNLAARALSQGQAAVQIGVCIPREIHNYFDQLRNGILAEAHRFEPLGIEILYHPTERLGENERERVAQVLREDIQVLILTPGNPQQLIPLINEAEQSNIRVICVDTDASQSARSTMVGVDAGMSGRLAAELMGKFLRPRSEVAVITGMLQTEDHRNKTEGFRLFFPRYCANGQVTAIVEAHDDDAEGFQKCSALLKKHPSLKGLYVSTANCLPVCRAIRSFGLAGKVRLITTDLFPGMAPFFDDGTIFASIHGRPFAQGQISLRLAVDHLLHQHPLPSSYFLTPQVVMHSTLPMFSEIRESSASEIKSSSLRLADLEQV
jgi:LacI family transcriptional regulator